MFHHGYRSNNKPLRYNCLPRRCPAQPITMNGDNGVVHLKQKHLTSERITGQARENRKVILARILASMKLKGQVTCSGVTEQPKKDMGQLKMLLFKLIDLPINLAKKNGQSYQTKPYRFFRLQPPFACLCTLSHF